MHRTSRLLPLVLASSLLAACSGLSNVPPAERKAVVVSFDGGAERVIERMLAEGVMPNLAKLRADGVASDYSRTNFPSKTAAGHAALWTGAFGNTNGITSNHLFKLPLAAHTVLETQSAFSSTSLLAEPIFATVARAGRRALVLQATQLSPFSTYEPGGSFGGPFRGSLSLNDGFAGVYGDDGVDKDAKAWHAAEGWSGLPASGHPVEEAKLSIAGDTLYALAYDDPRDPVDGYDTLRLYSRKDGEFQTLKPAQAQTAGAPAGWSRPVEVTTRRGPAKCFFRLFALSPKLDSWLLYHTAPTHAATNKPELYEIYFADNPFIPYGAQRPWRTGQFGPTMYQGGDGAAEDRYLETLAFMMARAGDRARLAFKRRDWDLLVSYIPLPDEAEHVWYGSVDETSPSYDARLAPHVWQELSRVCALVDGYIGVLREGAGRDTVLAVASDHGFAGLKWDFMPNTVLRQAGLLAVDKQGHIDLSRTQVLYPPTDGTYLTVNLKGRNKDGIVERADVPAVLAKAEAALRKVMAHNGQPLVTEFLRPNAETAELGLGGVRGGDLYLDLQPGYMFNEDADNTNVFRELPPGIGNHIFDPRRPDMHAIQYYVGPGVKHGVAIGPVRNEDLAPTICHLLGIPAPAQATGRVIEEALEPVAVPVRP